MRLTPKQIDALTEIFNIGIGHGASVLKTMLRSSIRLHLPSMKVLSPLELKNEIDGFGRIPIAAVELGFKGAFPGTGQLLFPSELTSKLITAIVEEDPEKLDIDSIRPGVLGEIGNVVLNGVMGTIANILGLQFEFSVPCYLEETAENLFRHVNVNSDNLLLLARTQFVLEDLDIEGDIILFFEIEAVLKLLEAIEHYTGEMGTPGYERA